MLPFPSLRGNSNKANRSVIQAIQNDSVGLSKKAHAMRDTVEKSYTMLKCFKRCQTGQITGVIIQQIVTLSKYGHDALDICHP